MEGNESHLCCSSWVLSFKGVCATGMCQLCSDTCYFFCVWSDWYSRTPERIIPDLLCMECDANGADRPGLQVPRGKRSLPSDTERVGEERLSKILNFSHSKTDVGETRSRSNTNVFLKRATWLGSPKCRFVCDCGAHWTEASNVFFSCD